MGSINDFARGQMPQPAPRRRRSLRRWRLLAQILGAFLLTLGVWQLSGVQGVFGDYARYIRDEGLSMSESWFPFEEILPAAAIPASPEFLLPVSGMVVRDFSQSQEEGQVNAGVLIQGEEGQQVKASAAGIITGITQVNGYYLLEIDHQNGFTSLYGNLSQVGAVKGQKVKAGAGIGLLGNQPLSFSLLQDGAPQDPLLWLFIKSQV